MTKKIYLYPKNRWSTKLQSLSHAVDVFLSRPAEKRFISRIGNPAFIMSPESTSNFSPNEFLTKFLETEKSDMVIMNPLCGGGHLVDDADLDIQVVFFRRKA